MLLFPFFFFFDNCFRGLLFSSLKKQKGYLHCCYILHFCVVWLLFGYLGGAVLIFTLITYQETLDALAEMYSQLNEEDMWGGLWQQRCRYPETATAIAYETQGFYEQAQSTYELVRSVS